MTMSLVSTVTVGSGGAASIDFTSIPQTGTDLLVVLSVQGNINTYLRMNGDSGANYSEKSLYGNGATVASISNTGSNQIGLYVSPANTSTFGNASIYIPNYAGSSAKSTSADIVTENNATTAYQRLNAGLWSGIAAITQLTFTPASGSFSQYSTASLYTITKGSGGATVS